MYPNYNYYPQTPTATPRAGTPYVNNTPMMPQQQLYLKGRPVSSLEEVRATMIDFDGSIFYFPDPANRCIYTKQIGMDGSAIFNIYELKAFPTAAAPMDSSIGYITREEFDNTIKQLKLAISSSQDKNIQQQQQQQQQNFQPTTDEQLFNDNTTVDTSLQSQSQSQYIF